MAGLPDFLGFIKNKIWINLVAMTPEEQRTLDLFEAVESRPDINQRQLMHLDISLGLANAFLKTILNKGWIRARKVRHVAGYTFSLPREVWRKVDSLWIPSTHPEIIREIRNQADRLLADLTLNGVHGIHLIGKDFIDIIGLCLEHQQMQCLSKIVKPRIDTEIDYSEWLPDQLRNSKPQSGF